MNPTPSPPPPGAYYRATATRNNMDGNLGSPPPSGHYVGLTPEVSSMSGATTRSVSAAVTNHEFCSPAEERIGVPRLIPPSCASTSITDVIHHVDASFDEDGSNDLVHIYGHSPLPPRRRQYPSPAGDSVLQDRCAAAASFRSDADRPADEDGEADHPPCFSYQSKQACSFVLNERGSNDEDELNGGEQDTLRSVDCVDDEDEEDSTLCSPVLPTLSAALMLKANPVDVLRTRIHALGTAILRITETALTETGASLEDSLKLEHKVGPKKPKSRKKRAAQAAIPGKAKKTPPRASTTAAAVGAYGGSSAKREPSTARGGTARGTPRQPRVPQSTRRGDSTGSSKSPKRPGPGAAKKRPAKLSPTTRSSEDSGSDSVGANGLERTVAPLPSGDAMMPTYDVYVDTPQEVVAMLDAAPSLTRYETLLARRQGRQAAGAATSDYEADDDADSRSDCNDAHTDRAPLYDASNAAVVAAGLKESSEVPPKSWAEVRERVGLHLTETGTDEDPAATACGVKLVAVPTLTGTDRSSWTSLSPSVLSARELSEDERTSVASLLNRRRPSETRETLPSLNDGSPTQQGGPEEPVTCFHVLYLHRFDASEGNRDAWVAAGNEVSSLETTPRNREGTTGADGTAAAATMPRVSRATAAVGGTTYYRALFSGSSQGGTGAPSLPPAPSQSVRVSLNVAATNERVRDYAQRCVTSAQTRTERTPAREDPLTPSPAVRSPSECSQTAAIESRIRRLDAWHSTSLQGTKETHHRRRRRHSLFFSSVALPEAKPGYAGTQFYYYAPTGAASASLERNDGDEALDYTPLNVDAAHGREVSGSGTGVDTSSGAIIDVLLTSPSQPDPPSKQLNPLAGTRGSGQRRNSTSAGVVNLSSPLAAACSRHTAGGVPNRRSSACLPSSHRSSFVASGGVDADDRTSGDDEKVARRSRLTAAPSAGHEEVAPSKFLEVVIASDYDAVEWFSAGAARRHRSRKRVVPSPELTKDDCGDTATAHNDVPADDLFQPRPSVVPALSVLSPTAGAASITSSSIAGAPVRRQSGSAALFLFVGTADSAS